MKGKTWCIIILWWPLAFQLKTAYGQFASPARMASAHTLPQPSLRLPGWRISPDFYARHTGFFCQQERLLEKKTTLPFRFRLGSLADTRKWEGYTY